jgi:hypothetical protein
MICRSAFSENAEANDLGESSPTGVASPWLTIVGGGHNRYRCRTNGQPEAGDGARRGGNDAWTDFRRPLGAVRCRAAQSALSGGVHLAAALFVLEFFDFLVVGYLLAVLAPQWHLTYGQSAVILYSGGVGTILGALVFGGLSDAWGRKITMVIGTLICAVSSGLMGIVPSGAWEVFAVLRFFIGVELTAGVRRLWRSRSS